MTKSVQHLAEEIVAREGGFVNDPDDPGGATKHGVTIHTMRNLGLDLDRDGDVDVADVQRLTVDQAVDIFLRRYLYAPRINQLPEQLVDTVFDMQVNAGNNAVKILQRLVTEMGFPAVADGAIGPKTLAAVQAATAAAPGFIRDGYGIARRNYYFALADARPASRKYARTRAGGKGGWITRAEEFIAPRYHMSAAKFRERTKAWA
ncbi:holin-associated N-acetylmuramidase [Pseudooceanicola algae]|uniref:Uncharacterized protein n=1 Tax=Pseudooceanicola algae TaxID=1537215 RepID=A0A418SK51_9RHOB|nr:holin-associated N-acetylmuramidase [Pseudooceanicola algae]QPM89165.1 hypothetical protein PSAL_003760 [Pseudooceanicola algae]